MTRAPRAGEDELTVFVISAGEQVTNECLAALERQTRTFRLEAIRDVYPMSAAFQAMPDRCRTPFFVQVDADMVLEPHAVETLHRAMRRSSPRTSTVSAYLYTEGVISGMVKCWRRSVFRFFRFRDVRTVDRDLYRRMRRWGIKQRELKIPIGVHRAHGWPEGAWLKAKADVEKWRFLGRPVERYALPQVRALIASRTGDGNRLAGSLLGALTTEPRLSRSKDLRFERRLRKEVLRFVDTSRLDTAPDSGVLDRVSKSFATAYSGGDRSPLAHDIAELFSVDPQAAARLLELSDS
jgi:hypothetical protein